jgi:acetyl esterase/lipase
MTYRLPKLSLLLALALSFAPQLHAQAGAAIPPPIYLWPNGAPGALGNAEADKPRMYVFLPKTRSTSAAILVIPGGGYQHVAIGHEGFQIATWLNAQGMAAFVLDYRVAPYQYPVEIDDGRRAMRLIRTHAAEYGIDPNRLGVWGSSAGGHLASSLGTHCESVTDTTTNKNNVPVTVTNNALAGSDPVDAQSCKPDFMVLEYPVISMEGPITHAGSRSNLLGPNPDPVLAHEYSNQFAVTPQTPPTFIWATTNDATVQVENSLDFYRALERAHVPAELHIYDYKDHGCGLCGAIVPLSTWPLLLRNWLLQHSYLPPNAPPMPPPEPNSASWPQGLTGPGQINP